MKSHESIEVLAGAIALGEATEAQRAAYREHIALCARCLHELGGEHEIERVASSVQSARDEEVWQPQLRDVVATAAARRSRSQSYTAIAALLAAAAVVTAYEVPRTHAPHDQKGNVALVPAVAVQNAHARVERKIAVPHSTRAAAAAPQLIVQHNVVQITRAPIAAPPAVNVAVTPAPIADIVVHAPPSRQSRKITSSRHAPSVNMQSVDTWRTVAQTTTTSLSESAPETVSHRAEALQITPQHFTRDASPVGGETAITPHPAMIAYEEGAEGTAVFAVLIDERGVPTKCVITKPSGYAVLDAAVCKAAMQSRYSPKSVDGRAVPGVYNDAFTFRMSGDDQNIEGIPKQIP